MPSGYGIALRVCRKEIWRWQRLHTLSWYQRRNLALLHQTLEDDPTFCIIDIHRLICEKDTRSQSVRDLKANLDTLRHALKIGAFAALLMPNTSLGRHFSGLIDALVDECTRNLVLLRTEVGKNQFRHSEWRLFNSQSRSSLMERQMADIGKEVERIGNPLYRVLAAIST